MTRAIGVVVPVKDGARFLPELLRALAAQDVAEVLVIDSGSADGSVGIARDAGARVHEIEPQDFGHGRTRNLGAELVEADVVAFLTQDATPLPGWTEAIREGLGLGDRVAAVYGPHRARPDTSPMIARELDGFFAMHAADDGGPAIDPRGADPWLSNVNAAYRRDVLRQLPFPDVPYSEDQAFARAAHEAGWSLAYHPGMAVLHAHDYPPLQFARRYFDEYRGLRETVGHVESAAPLAGLRTVRNEVAADRAWMREQGMPAGQRLAWTGRAVRHHANRRVFSALGSRAHALPAPVQKAISLEGTASTAPPPPRAQEGPTGVPQGKPIPKAQTTLLWDPIRRFHVEGAAPLLAPLQDVDRPLHVAVVIPPFNRGSGGHTSIFQITSRLEGLGHTVSYWLDDRMGLMRADRAARIRGDVREWFAPVEGPFHKGFADWAGADVVVATGWQTAHPVMLLGGCRARAYLVHDHETEFYGTSVERLWAEETYRLGMHAICSSPWLAEICAGYGCTTSTFDFGVDHDVYRPRPQIARRHDTVAMYGRDVTPRRAVSLAIFALQELRRRRPDLRVVSFGNLDEIDMPFPYVHMGVRRPEELARIYSEATVGLVLSMTNYSLIPKEMLACGLPCVDLAGVSAEGVFGEDGPVALTRPDILELAVTIERLLDDREEWERRSAAGPDFVADHTWDRAALQVQDGLREALRARQ